MSAPINFEYSVESIRTTALTLDHFVVPWDTEILGVPVAQVAELRVTEPLQAAHDYERFVDWCCDREIELCSCRLPAERVGDSMFLEDRGFRFIELNYLPRLTGVQDLDTDNDGIVVTLADAEDRGTLADMAANVFRHGRFHQDPRIDPALGDRRYRRWLENAFVNPQQQVLKCLEGDSIVGFCVVETPEPEHCFWSLNALAPGLAGQGLGRRVWRAMLHWHRQRGAHTVSTSISSQNAPALNLYVSLGFRFPAPTVTLHWCPRGRLG